MALKVEKLRSFKVRKLIKKYPLKKDKETLHPDCFLYSTFKANKDDYEMFLDELKTARVLLYKFDGGRTGIGQTKICPWCLGGKVKVEDWTAHCKQHHPFIESPDDLRRVFIGYRCQAALYKLLTVRLRLNWKQIGILEGGCYQCMDTNIMFDGTKNEIPKRCVRMDTPKSRMRSWAFLGINIRKFKKKLELEKDVLVGGILYWPKTLKE